MSVKKTTTKKVVKTKSPFNDELMSYIKDGQVQRERFVALTEEIGYTNVDNCL